MADPQLSTNVTVETQTPLMMLPSRMVTLTTNTDPPNVLSYPCISKRYYRATVRSTVLCPVSDCVYIIAFCRVKKCTWWCLKSTTSALFFCHGREFKAFAYTKLPSRMVTLTTNTDPPNVRDTHTTGSTTRTVETQTEDQEESHSVG
jgi:hypothetical protein